MEKEMNTNRYTPTDCDLAAGIISELLLVAKMMRDILDNDPDRGPDLITGALLKNSERLEDLMLSIGMPWQDIERLAKSNIDGCFNQDGMEKLLRSFASKYMEWESSGKLYGEGGDVE